MAHPDGPQDGPHGPLLASSPSFRPPADLPASSSSSSATVTFVSPPPRSRSSPSHFSRGLSALPPVRPSVFLILAILPTVVLLSLAAFALRTYTTMNLETVTPEADSTNLLGPTNWTRRLPQCLIIGVRKGGTRAVLKFLSIHPNVVIAGREAHFFDRNARYQLGLDWYRHYMPFSSAQQLTVEKTPAYFHHPLVPERMFRFNPHVKLIVVLRDPLDRAVSDYTQVLTNRRKKGRTYVPFENLAFNGGAVSLQSVRRDYRAIWRSLYNIHMQNWLRYFPLKSFHFVDGRRLVVDPAFELRRVETFLGLRHFITSQHFYFNKSRGFFCLKQTGCLASSKGRKHPALNFTTVEALRRFFSPHIQQFYRIIGRDFGWPLD